MRSPSDKVAIVRGADAEIGEAPGKWLAEERARVRARRAHHNALSRAGVPDDIERAVDYRASDGAAFVTGQTTILVDGGLTCQFPLSAEALDNPMSAS